MTIITALSSLAVLALTIASRFTCDGTTPNNVYSVIIDGNVDVFALALVKLELTISWGRVHKEALTEWASYYALSALEAICITSTLCVSRCLSVSA